MSESLISYFLLSDVSELHILLNSNEQCEWIAHFVHQKWANEWITHFFEWIAYLLIFRQKTSNSLGNQMSEVPARILQNWPILLDRCQ